MIKVLQIVGAGASDAICVGFDPAKFDVSRLDLSPGTTLLQLRRLIAEKRPDVVHTHATKARVAAWLAGVKKVLHSPVPRAYLGDFPEPLAHDGLVVGSCGRMTRVRNPDAWVLLAQRLTDSRNGVTCAPIRRARSCAASISSSNTRARAPAPPPSSRRWLSACRSSPPTSPPIAAWLSTASPASWSTVKWRCSSVVSSFLTTNLSAAASAPPAATGSAAIFPGNA